MSFATTRGLAAAVTLAAALAGSAVAIPQASAATAQCGSLCASFHPLSYGTSDVLAVEGASGTKASQGQKVTIAAASSTNQAEDWVLEDEGTVSEFYEAGLMSAEMNLHWGSDQVYQITYAPDGTWTGFCLGVSSTNGSGSVTLQPCGETAAALWVADTADASGRALPLINGDNNNFSNPYSLTASSPGTQLTSSQLLGITTSQEWGTIYGEL
ncbi:MAG TPA: hypothetical protein VGH27_31085 [Streptosporangiaceae bacterium]